MKLGNGVKEYKTQFACLSHILPGFSAVNLFALRFAREIFVFRLHTFGVINKFRKNKRWDRFPDGKNLFCEKETNNYSFKIGQSANSGNYFLV